MSPGSEQAQTEELTQQIVHLGNLVTELADHVKALEAKNVDIEAELLRARSLLFCGRVGAVRCGLG